MFDWVLKYCRTLENIDIIKGGLCNMFGDSAKYREKIDLCISKRPWLNELTHAYARIKNPPISKPFLANVPMFYILAGDKTDQNGGRYPILGA